MEIDNMTSDPVDYDVDIGPRTLTRSVSGVGDGQQPRFRIGAGETFTYELAGSGTLRHVFVVADGSSQTRTVIELANAPSRQNVRLKSTVVENSATGTRETFYRAELY